MSSNIGAPGAGATAACILIAWELGGGWGHLAKALLLAERLREGGSEVVFVVRDLRAAHRLLPPDYLVFQAPLALTLLKDAPPPADYAELLLHAGFGEPDGVESRVRAWLALYKTTRARLLVADHSPTAVLAARCAALPTMLFGNGFFAPPSVWSPFRVWEAPPAARLAAAQEHVLDVVNRCLRTHLRPPLRRAAELLEVEANVLCTYPELDHYPGRDNAATFIGPVWLDDFGDAPAWPPAPASGAVRRVFAYLRHGLPGLHHVLDAIDELDASVVLYFDRITPEVRARPRPANVVLTDSMLRLDNVAGDASLVLCSGSDTATGMATRGVPVLVLPMNAEQRILAMRLEALNVGRCWLDAPTPAPDRAMADLFDELATPAVQLACAALRAKYASQTVERAVDSAAQAARATLLALAG